MAKERVTLTLDAAKLQELRALVGARSLSASIDEAIEAYVQHKRHLGAVDEWLADMDQQYGPVPVETLAWAAKLVEPRDTSQRDRQREGARRSLPVMQRDLLDLLAARRGHFRLESGHHGDLWLDLDALLERPARLAPLIAALGDRLSAHRIDAVCGPLTGGAFLAFTIAARLDLPFVPAERFADDGAARYRVPAALRPRLAGRAFAVVDDVINAGSAVAATCAELRACGAEVRAIAALAMLGSHATRLGLPIEATVAIDNTLWSPAECPLCASGVPLEDLVPG